jgi:hypothetical protein
MQSQIIRESLPASAGLIRHVRRAHHDSDNNKGGSMGSPYQFSPYAGPPFENLEADEHVTTGACHCGAVTIAIKGPKPANRTVIECNCNFCWRVSFFLSAHFRLGQSRLTIVDREGAHLPHSHRRPPERRKQSQLYTRRPKPLRRFLQNVWVPYV